MPPLWSAVISLSLRCNAFTSADDIIVINIGAVSAQLGRQSDENIFSFINTKI